MNISSEERNKLDNYLRELGFKNAVVDAKFIGNLVSKLRENRIDEDFLITILFKLNRFIKNNE